MRTAQELVDDKLKSYTEIKCPVTALETMNIVSKQLREMKERSEACPELYDAAYVNMTMPLSLASDLLQLAELALVQVMLLYEERGDVKVHIQDVPENDSAAVKYDIINEHSPNCIHEIIRRN